MHSQDNKNATDTPHSATGQTLAARVSEHSLFQIQDQKNQLSEALTATPSQYV